MKKVKTTIYVVLYSFLVCIAMSMGVFAVSMPQIETYTNIFYHTKTPMIGKTNFQNAYLALNEEATSIGNPVISEIYFDSYEDADRDTYNFTEGNGVLVSTNVLSTIDVSQAQDESIFAHYYTYYNRETSSHIGAMFILSTETITMPENSGSFFKDFSEVKIIKFNNIDTSVVKNPTYMFQNCTSLTEVDVSKFDATNFTYISGMFSGCKALKSVDLSSFRPSNLTSITELFNACSSLESVKLQGIDTSHAYRFDLMFKNCSALTSIDLSSLNTSGATNMKEMFSG